MADNTQQHISPSESRLAKGFLVLLVSAVVGALSLPFSNTSWSGLGFFLGAIAWLGNIAGLLILAVGVRDAWRRLNEARKNAERK